MPTVIYWSNGLRRPENRRERIVEFAVRTVITAAAVWLAAKIVGGIHLDGLGTTLLVALILGLLNASLKPLLVLGALPLVILSLGIGLVIINAALLGLTSWIAGWFDLAFHVDGFWAAVWGAVIVSLASFILTRVVDPRRVARSVG